MNSVAPEILGFTEFDPALLRSRVLFEKVFICQRDSVLILDNECIPNIVDCNPATEKIFGYGREQLLGQPISLLHPDGELKERRQSIVSTARKEGFCYLPELWMKRRDGTLFPCEHTVTPLCNERGRCFGWMMVTHDITERVQKENALRERAEKFKRFAYSICHDLKNATVALRWFAERLADRYGHLLDEQGNMCCERIRTTSDEIMLFIDSLNAYISTKECTLNIDEIDLDEVFQTIKEQFSHRAQARGVRLSAPECTVKLRADRMSLIRALRNLIDNALKHGGDRLNEISLGYLESDEFHIISVKDDGKGLNGEDKEIFEFFKRGVRSKGIPGAGLGLSIVKEIAVRHGGSISIEPGPKTEFLLSISKRLQCSSN
jgi:PAS domain S-box-containing protein